ncbi:hypothetical protein CNN69_18450, partial [Escherichia coli]
EGRRFKSGPRNHFPLESFFKYTVKTSAFVVGFEKILLESAPDRSCGYRVQLYKAPIYRGFLLSDYRITGL